MKVLMLNGSRNEKGCTFTALSEIAKELTAAGIDSEIVHIGKDAVNGNIDAAVKAVAAKMKESDGLVIGSPVYYASASGEIIAFLDRLFSTAGSDLRHKPGNMAWILQCIEAGKKAGVQEPAAEQKVFTNFIR